MIGMGTLGPVVALAAWTMVMWLWMYITRLPAMRRAKIDIGALRGGTGADLKGVLPQDVQWKADNYNHLHEAPTVFYAIAITLAIVGQGDGWNAIIAWIYVALRVAHSLVQATVNRIALRFAIFMLSSLALIALVLHAAIAVFH
ncbi:MAPEG family protein [Altererythrobacter sp. CAU 1778]